MARERMPALPTPHPGSDLLYVTSPAAAKHLSLSYRALAADLYWIRAIQYYGGVRLSDSALKS